MKINVEVEKPEKSIDMIISNVVEPLGEVFQEDSAKIKVLEEEVAHLRNDVEELKESIAELSKLVTLNFARIVAS
jgi:peptidoglycan hydrolase CwlO-like protein